MGLGVEGQTIQFWISIWTLIFYLLFIKGKFTHLESIMGPSRKREVVLKNQIPKIRTTIPLLDIQDCFYLVR